MNALVNANLEKAGSLLADEYIGYGPASTDSTTRKMVLNTWKRNYMNQVNRKVGFVNNSFTVLQGNLKGDWVSTWGNYSCTISDKNIKVPFQYTARIAEGKIVTDRIYYDMSNVLQTLGYKFSGPFK